MRLIALAILACHLPLLCPARSMAIPSHLKDRVITVAFEELWGVSDKDRTQPGFILAAYDQIKLVRAAINADPETPGWMKADDIGVISIDEAKTSIHLRFPDTLDEQEIHNFHLRFIGLHAKAMFDAEEQIVESLGKAIRSLKAAIETEQDPIRRRLLNSILDKTQDEWRMYHLM